MPITGPSNTTLLDATERKDGQREPWTAEAVTSERQEATPERVGRSVLPVYEDTRHGDEEAVNGRNPPQLMSVGERAVDDLLRAAHLAAPHDMPALITKHAAILGGRNAVAYVADLQQLVLVPFVGSRGPDLGDQLEPLPVDSTLAGRAFQHVEVCTHSAAAGSSETRVWLPLIDGTDRLGVLGVTVNGPRALEEDDGLLGVRLRRFAALVAELIATKTSYGDTIVRTRRRTEMGLAAEVQWGLLPPLTFACEQVVVAGALEPAYEVAGDSVDYAVDAGYARFAVLDGMGHGLHSAQLATLAVAAYRNARRSGRSLTETAHRIGDAIAEVYNGDAFTTAVIAELDTDSGTLSWVNAGHPEPLLLRDGRLVKSLHIEPGVPLGLGLGLATSTAYGVGTERLQPGDRVLLYTDGVTDARSPDGEFFGIDRLIDLLTRNLASGLPAPEVMRRIVRSLLEHQQGQLVDDATLLLVEWCSGTQSTLVP
jgi:Stage II sporulation protein E (SpoIIE)